MDVALKGRSIIDSIKGSNTHRISAFMVPSHALIEQPLTQMTKLSRADKKTVRYSVNFVRALSFYSLMQGFFIRLKKRLINSAQHSRTVDLILSCGKVIDICEVLFNSVPGEIEHRTAVQVYDVLDRFYTTNLEKAEYLAVFNFYLLYIVNFQEDFVIKDKKKNAAIDELIGLLSYLCDVVSEDVMVVFQKKMKGKVKHEKITKAVDAFVERQHFKAGAIYKSYISAFESIRYESPSKYGTAHNEAVVNKYKKLIQSVPDWKDKLLYDDIDTILNSVSERK